jgi:hypothetical protein
MEKDTELTRRRWLLILGGATVVGFSGVVPEWAAAFPDTEGRQPAALPPGLYSASNEHLSHALHGLGETHNIAPGSETEYVSSSSVFHPQFLSSDELKIATRVSEILLGKVDARALSRAVQWLDLYLYSAKGVRETALHLDPLHRAIAAAYHGEAAIRELETADPQSLVRSGMKALQKRSMELYGREFLVAGEEQQAKLVASMATLDGPLRQFFELMRTEAVRGYYTTAVGLQELDYKGNWYYAVCPGCDHK